MRAARPRVARVVRARVCVVTESRYAHRADPGSAVADEGAPVLGPTRDAVVPEGRRGARPDRGIANGGVVTVAGRGTAAIGGRGRHAPAIRARRGRRARVQVVARRAVRNAGARPVAAGETDRAGQGGRRHDAVLHEVGREPDQIPARIVCGVEYLEVPGDGSGEVPLHAHPGAAGEPAVRGPVVGAGREALARGRHEVEPVARSRRVVGDRDREPAVRRRVDGERGRGRFGDAQPPPGQDLLVRPRAREVDHVGGPTHGRDGQDAEQRQVRERTHERRIGDPLPRIKAWRIICPPRPARR